MKRIIQYLPTILAAALITYLSLLREPHITLPQEYLFPHIDKVVHFCMYLFLSVIMANDLHRDKQRLTIVCLLSVLISSFYGGLIEILQDCYFPPRTGEWLDWVADTAGAIAGFCIYLLIRKLL